MKAWIALCLALAACEKPPEARKRHVDSPRVKGWCKPEGECRACSTCENCRHCSVKGGKCSVCR